eukprot:UN03194
MFLLSRASTLQRIVNDNPLLSGMYIKEAVASWEANVNYASKSETQYYFYRFASHVFSNLSVMGPFGNHTSCEFESIRSWT